eukprot:4272263-Ditylum_brightwellii.AAC.1
MMTKYNLNKRLGIMTNTSSQDHIIKNITKESVTMSMLAGSMFSPLTALWKSRGSVVNNKVDKMIKEHNNTLHVISNFKGLLISLSDDRTESIISDTL